MKLKIQSANCMVSKNSVGDIDINNESIDKLITSNLPEIENYKNYVAKVNIEIELLGQEELSITTEGYKVEDKKESEDEE